MKNKLFTRNFILVTIATIFGAIGGIAGSFALSFLVFDETGSTLASAIIMSIQIIPYVFVPVIIAPFMDRLPRKAFLVGGDIVNGFIYIATGVWLLYFDFSYIAYLMVSMLLACLSSVDELAYKSIYPELIPKGEEEKGYSVSSMLYPVLKVLMLPLSAVLLGVLGVALILVLQGILSLAAAFTESFIKLPQKEEGKTLEAYSIRQWMQDIKEAVKYLKEERGLRSIFTYVAITNGLANGFGPILIAFFRTFPGMTAAMYSFFSVAEFVGRSLGSALQYRINIPKEKKHGFVLFVYQVYELMDMCLLWLPYPLMLVNRAVCGFLGSNSSIVRTAAVQRYIPEELRARINAFSDVFICFSIGIFSLLIGILGEFVDYRLCVTICGAVGFISSAFFIWARGKDVRKVYEK